MRLIAQNNQFCLNKVPLNRKTQKVVYVVFPQETTSWNLAVKPRLGDETYFYQKLNESLKLTSKKIITIWVVKRLFFLYFFIYFFNLINLLTFHIFFLICERGQLQCKRKKDGIPFISAWHLSPFNFPLRKEGEMEEPD